MTDLTKEQHAALWRVRVIWAFLLLGQVALGAALLGVMLTRGGAPADDMHGYIALAALLLLLIVTPLAYFVRNQIYKANWQANTVTPRGYVSGNAVLLAMLETVGMVGLVMMFISAWPIVPGLAAALAMAVQAVNFPTGEPMRPHPPDFVRSSD